MAVVGTKAAAGVVGIGSDVVGELFEGGESAASSDIMQLKEEISKLITDALRETATRLDSLSILTTLTVLTHLLQLKFLNYSRIYLTLKSVCLFWLLIMMLSSKV